MPISQSVTMTPPASSSGPYEWPTTKTLVWTRGKLPETQREYVFGESERDIPICQGDETPGGVEQEGYRVGRDEASGEVAEQFKAETYDAARVCIRIWRRGNPPFVGGMSINRIDVSPQQDHHPNRG
jgi:hypothetical protein